MKQLKYILQIFNQKLFFNEGHLLFLNGTKNKTSVLTKYQNKEDALRVLFLLSHGGLSEMSPQRVRKLQPLKT